MEVYHIKDGRAEGEQGDIKQKPVKLDLQQWEIAKELTQIPGKNRSDSENPENTYDILIFQSRKSFPDLLKK